VSTALKSNEVEELFSGAVDGSLQSGDDAKLRDALAAVSIPFVEVHVSNVFAREAFRRESYFTDIAVGIVSGLGARGYELALEFALQYSGKR